MVLLFSEKKTVLTSLIPAVFVCYVFEHIVFQVLRLQASFEIDPISRLTLKEVNTAPRSRFCLLHIFCQLYELLLRECY